MTKALDICSRPTEPLNEGAARRVIYTLSLQTANISAVEVAALVGYDGITIDLEHGVLNRESTDQLIVVCKQSGLRSFARVAAPLRHEIQYILDSGADGVIIPHIEDLAHAKQICSYAKYPPVGSRSIPGGRTWGYSNPAADWMTVQNNHSKCFPMVETAGALADVDEILALPSVDGIFVGVHDLNISRGRGGLFGDDDDKDLRIISAAASKAGKPWGMYLYSEAELFKANRLGASFVSLPDDITCIMLQAKDNLLTARRIFDASPTQSS